MSARSPNTATIDDMDDPSGLRGPRGPRNGFGPPEGPGPRLPYYSSKCMRTQVPPHKSLEPISLFQKRSDNPELLIAELKPSMSQRGCGCLPIFSLGLLMSLKSPMMTHGRLLSVERLRRSCHELRLLDLSGWP
nr:hypothetical protein Iba_chr03bCG4350 [Ipomoea batatas]